MRGSSLQTQGTFRGWRSRRYSSRFAATEPDPQRREPVMADQNPHAFRILPGMRRGLASELPLAGGDTNGSVTIDLPGFFVGGRAPAAGGRAGRRLSAGGFLDVDEVDGLRWAIGLPLALIVGTGAANRAKCRSPR